MEGEYMQADKRIWTKTLKGAHMVLRSIVHNFGKLNKSLNAIHFRQKQNKTKILDGRNKWKKFVALTVKSCHRSS